MSDSGAPDHESPSPALQDLARACGVALEYTAASGEHKTSSAAAIRKVLAAMGVDGSDDHRCADALNRLEDLRWERLVPAITVVRQGQEAVVPVHVPHGEPASSFLTLESGEVRELEQLDIYLPPRSVGEREIGRASFRVPGDLPLGWHRLEGRTTGMKGKGWVVVTPQRVEIPQEVREARPYGLHTQLYSVRSSRSWGLGDFADLGDLCALAKVRAGADFVLVNPLHAAEPVPPISNSPYSPSSRRYLNPMYIRVEDIPEVAYLPSQQRAVLEWESERPRRVNGTDALLDRDSAWRAKKAALEHVFKASRSVGRDAQFEAYCLREGRALEDFATWCALAEAHRGVPWPDEMAKPHSAEVSQWREQHPDRVMFYAWLQWIAQEQLANAQVRAREAGMMIGVMTDLAVGVHPEGADSWALQSVLARGVAIGAPPDAFNQMGQNWALPPWNPRALEASAYMPFRDLVRAAVSSAGALRIDHVLGLFRQWWVPDGHRADDGAYVNVDHEALIGIVALEAQRAGAIVIGEDLGTVEPWVMAYLNERGLLGTVVQRFEWRDGHPLAPEDYRSDVLVAVTTHDHPPTASYLAGTDLDVPESLGLIVGDVEEQRERGRREVADLTRYLDERGWLPIEHSDEDILAGMHTLVLNTPALLSAIAVTDLVGDMRTQNQPGTFTEYPNWQIPLTDSNGVPVLLDDLFEHPRVRRLVTKLKTARG
ncbi:4-alpha-glucanotransferase [Demequina sp. SYSU T00b26]|uniref:4-alpha-glucanotransferase n=1 Tax=Demequina zhanjiangensis TaxID=3051659 RepID=A0ABT8G1G2_9MICO|nr:4-alpha-glucanotransferase [Demequina sp. SYSU T00b26]MDN4472971.1 4-alpha-glucanotransferase [Demequina sp. SYSU T00b26]